MCSGVIHGCPPDVEAGACAEEQLRPDLLRAVEG